MDRLEMCCVGFDLAIIFLSESIGQRRTMASEILLIRLALEIEGSWVAG